MKLFAAIKAFVVCDGKVLLVRESSRYDDGTHAGKFDVVGGRVKPGERFDEGLLREIKEETGLAVTIGAPFFVDEWRPSVRGEQWHIIGTFVECTAKSEQVSLSDDHEEYIWIDPAQYTDHEIIDNLRPVFEAFLERRS